MKYEFNKLFKYLINCNHAFIIENHFYLIVINVY